VVLIVLCTLTLFKHLKTCHTGQNIGWYFGPRVTQRCGYQGDAPESNGSCILIFSNKVSGCANWQTVPWTVIQKRAEFYLHSQYKGLSR